MSVINIIADILFFCLRRLPTKSDDPHDIGFKRCSLKNLMDAVAISTQISHPSVPSHRPRFTNFSFKFSVVRISCVSHDMSQIYSLTVVDSIFSPLPIHHEISASVNYFNCSSHINREPISRHFVSIILWVSCHRYNRIICVIYIQMIWSMKICGT